MTSSEFNPNLKKLNSLNALKNSNLPIMKFKILSANFRNEAKDFLKETNSNLVMVRTDGKGEFSPSILDAKVNEELFQKIQSFFDEGYTVFLMDNSGSTHRNRHSLNIMKYSSEIIIEIVGPGFLATDLNRHGMLHEEIIVHSPDIKVFSTKVHATSDKYQKDIQKKIEKYTKEVLEKEKSYIFEFPQYLSFEDWELEFVLRSIPLIDKASKFLGNGVAWVASMSFVDFGEKREKPIFWDLYLLK